MKCGKILGLLDLSVAVLLLFAPSCAEAQSARITNLSDVAFGTIVNFTTDLIKTQNVCAYTTPLGTSYHVIGSGSGAGGAFTLANGASTMAYEVQWATATGQTSGTALRAGISQGGFTTTATSSRCTSGTLPTASLITILRATAVSAATSGNYTGTLTLILGPN